MSQDKVQPIRSVGLSAPRYRYIQRGGTVLRIPLGLWCKAVTGHKLDTDRSIAKSDGEICHPCKLCRALIGTGIYTQTIVTDNSSPLVTLT